MKKIIPLLLISLLLQGCSSPMDILYNKTKPNKFFYTYQISNNIKSQNNFSVLIFDTNLYKERELPSSYLPNLHKFITSIKDISYMDKPEDLPKKPAYKIFITTGPNKDERFVINVYNDSIASIYPWDGVYEEDFIDMRTIQRAYNLLGLCNYVFK